MVRVQVLGTFTARNELGQLDLGGPRQRAVLGRLVAARRQLVSVDRLIDDIWGPAPPMGAQATLQSSVSRLRRALEPHRAPRTPAALLATTPPGYTLRLDEDQVDAWRFEAVVKRAQAQPDQSVVVDELTTALSWWHGSAFAEFSDQLWTQNETMRLGEIRATAVELRAGALIELGSVEYAIPELESHAAAYPLRETPVRLLVKALYLNGRTEDALSVIRRHRGRLRSELGMEPAAELGQLERDILRRLPPDRSGQHAGSIPTIRISARSINLRPVALAGRTAELATLEKIAETALRTGQPQVVLVTGEAGAGKSELVRQSLLTLADGEWAVAWGSCSRNHDKPAGHPVSEIVKALSSVLPPPAELAPLMDRGEFVAPSGAQAVVGRFQFHQAIGNFISQVAARTPFAAVLDDLHWADQETLYALMQVGQCTGPALLILTYREQEVDEQVRAVLAELARSGPHRIALTGLATDSVRELAGEVLGQPPSSDIAEQLTLRTGGNPFFVRELARLISTHGESALGLVPAGVIEVVRERVGRRGPSLAALLGCAALIGMEMQLALLEEVAELSDFPAVVAEAVSAGFLQDAGAGRIRFSHVLVRDSLDSEFTPVQRRDMHARIAKALTAQASIDAGALAHHYLSAGMPEPAQRYAHMAAEQAQSRYAHRDAARWLRVALDAFDRHAGDDVLRARERLELVLELVRAMSFAGEIMQAREFREEAVRAATRLGDPELTARIITSFDIPTLWTMQEYGDFSDYLFGVIDQTLPLLDDETLRCRLLITLAFESVDGGPRDRAMQAMAEALRLARSLNNPEVLALALNAEFFQSPRNGGDTSLLRIGNELLGIGRGHGLIVTEVLGEFILAEHWFGLDEVDKALWHAGNAKTLAERYELPMSVACAGWFDALAAVFRGDFEQAEGLYHSNATPLARAGMRDTAFGIAMLGVYTLRIFQGRLGELEDEAARLYARWPVQAADPYALILAELGRLDEAREIAAHADRDPRSDYFYDILLAFRGLVGLRLHDELRVKDAYRALLPLAGRTIGSATGAVTMGPADQL
ncbi:MAG: AAA family ATPase, partial [Corynebacteriales bacterium]|nr:AAA family ATPase [Mycobacteriales bacterium]